MIKLSIKRPVLTTMIMAALASIGLYCYIELPREMFPDIEFPIVTAVTIYEGAGPEEIEQLISKELEDEISQVEGIKHLYSTSQQGLSIVTAEFELDHDVDVAAADVRAKVDIVRPQLPDEAEDPIVQKFDFNAQPVMLLAVAAPRPLREVFEMADERIRDRLSSVPDVASVDVLGGEEREIHVLINQQRLRAYGLSIVQVLQAVAASNRESPGGHIRQDSKEYNIRLRGKYTDLDQIRDLQIALGNGSKVYLRDIAQVEDAHKEIRDKVRANGQTCVAMSIKKQAGGNAVKIDQAVREEIERLRQSLPEDFTITIEDEEATWITSSIKNVFDNMQMGIILTAVALFLFLHSFRSVIIISLTMPISVLATFIIMYMMGFTLNLMSLMGLAMTVGVLVNNAILVLENIYRYLHLGKSPQEAAHIGTSEIAVAVASTTLTNVVVFVPIAFMGGIVGQFFKDFGLTATFATIVSLFVSFTLAPMMAGRILTRENTTTEGKGPLRAFGRWFDGGLENLKGAYADGLRWVLRHRIVTLGGVLILLAGAFCLPIFGLIGFEFITPMDQGKFAIMVEMPTGTRLEETDAAMRRLETTLANEENLPELVSLVSSVGRSLGGEIGGASQGVNIGQINVRLVDKMQREQSTQEIMDRLRSVIAAANIPGATIKLVEVGAGGGGEAAIQMQIMGDDINEIKAFADEAVVILNDPCRVAGTVDVGTNYRVGQPEIRIVPKRDRCRDAGVDTTFLTQVVAASFEGLTNSEYRDGAFDYDIRVKLDEQGRDALQDVKNLTVANALGRRIPLPQIADIEIAAGPSQLFRKNRQSMITVSADVSGRSQGEVAADINKQMASLLEKYPGCRIFFGGETERMQESFARLGVAMIMAVCLTYMLLASLLESFVLPLLIMFSLPLSMIGVFTALFLMGGTFSIFSIMAIIMLVGLVINNSIIVIEYITMRRKEGVERTEAIVEAGTTRLRPILMANLTTVVALIPLAAGMGWGGEMRAPMAMVQIGGLIAGGWMGLLIVPMIYTIAEDGANFVKRLVTGKQPASAPIPTTE